MTDVALPMCLEQVLTKIKSFEIKGGSHVCAGLSSVLCTSHKTQSAGGSSALTLPPWGQLNLHEETGFYITSRLVTSTERESRSTPNWPVEVAPAGAQWAS